MEQGILAQDLVENIEARDQENEHQNIEQKMGVVQPNVDPVEHVINDPFDIEDINQEELGAIIRNLQQNKLPEVYLRIGPKPKPRFASSGEIICNFI